MIAISIQDRLQNEKQHKIWSKMSHCTILYISWELNESLRKMVFRNKGNGLRMRRSNPVAIKVTGIRPMAPMQNRGPLEDILAQNVFGKERNY